MTGARESRIANLIRALMDELGCEQRNLGGFIEVLRDNEPSHIFAACQVALRQRWERPPQPADLVQFMFDYQAYTAALLSWQARQPTKDVS